ncbi:MAG: UPF0146 family protein [Methanolinea sp.]|nr:UPF0146 family protein [Methanolinea sp.]
MEGLKHIERLIASYIARNYQNVAEVGVGNNPLVAEMLAERGLSVFCTDIRYPAADCRVRFVIDDIYSPCHLLYGGLDLIYAIRPTEEMIGPLIRLARTVNCDLLVYHLGFEGCGMQGEIIDCGVVLRLYNRRQNPSKRVF